VANWDLGALAGAGALRSTVNDLLIFAAAELGYLDTPLKAAMADQLAPRRPTDVDDGEIALGWIISQRQSREIAWHNGGTGGYRAFLGLDRERGVGVVVLTNVSNEAGGDDIGFHLLTGSALSPPPRARHAITLDAESLERFVGRYRMSAEVFTTITRDNEQLFAQLTGQPAFEVFPESPTEFFFKVVDAQITFAVDPDGRVTGLTAHQGGRDRVAPRVD
jgi:CubicO group peptidase (beta-lactamase class C family)